MFKMEDSYILKEQRDEWMPSRSDVAELRTKLTRNHPELKSFGGYLKKKLAQHNLYVGKQTFLSGLDVFLLTASRRGRLDIIKYFLKNHTQHFDINARIKYLRGSLVDKPAFLSGVAILPNVYNDEEESLQSLKNSMEWRATTLLHAAAVEGYIDVVKTLLFAGAEVDPLDCCSDTPLLKTIKLSPEMLRVIKFLIKRGADVNIKGGSSLTPLMCVSQLKTKSAAQLVQLLTDAGADLNMTDSRGYTALHFAVTEGNVEVVKKLLSSGANPLFSNRHIVQEVPSPLQVADQACLLAPVYHLLQSKLSTAKSNDYRRLKSMMINYEDVVSSATQPLPSGGARQFMSHPECPSSCKADGYLIEVITTAGKWMEESESPLLDRCRDLLQESLELTQRASSGTQDQNHKHDPKYKAVWKLKELLQDPNPSSSRDLIWQCMLLTELVGYGLEGTIHLMLKGCICLFNCQHYQDGLLLVQRASLHLLSLVEKKDYLLAGSDVCCTLLIRLLNTILHFIQKHSDQVPYSEWSSVLKSALENSTSSIVAYSKFITTTHPHLVPLCETELLAKGVLDILTYWMRLQEDESYIEAVRQLVKGCPTVIDSKNRCSTLLHLALRRKNSENLVTTLMRCGGKTMVNNIDYTGLRPLHLAAYLYMKHPGRNDPTIVIPSLLEHGAHIDAVDDGGLTADQYHLALDSSHTELLHSLLAESSVPSLSCLACKTITEHEIDYKHTDLPTHLKTVISYHDTHSERLQGLTVV